MSTHPELPSSDHPTVAPSARHGASETGQTVRLPGDTVTVQSNLAACNTSVTETVAKDVAGGTLRGRSESPAKRGPIAVGERGKDWMFPLVGPADVGPADVGPAIEFGRVQYRPHAEYIVRAVNERDELLAAAKSAREIIADHITELLRSFCVFDPEGEPIRDTLTGEDAEAVEQEERVLASIDAAIAKAEAA